MTLHLSPHFTIDEATVTSHKDIPNYPTKPILANMGYTAGKMEQVRELLANKPIYVNSWYRSPKLNSAVGGSKKSAHMDGRAVDFICPHFGTPYDICKWLESKRDLLAYDQLIYEGTWVHISFVIPPAVPRLESLTYESGKYVTGIVFKHQGGK